MAILRLNPNKIFLGGESVQVNDLAASETITPGHLIERWNNANVIRWRKHTGAAATSAIPVFAIDHAMANKGVDDVYNANDLVEAMVMQPGAGVWALIASGQNIVAGNRLESAGDGTLRIMGSGGLIAVALENKTASALTRIRVESA